MNANDNLTDALFGASQDFALLIDKSQRVLRMSDSFASLTSEVEDLVADALARARDDSATRITSEVNGLAIEWACTPLQNDTFLLLGRDITEVMELRRLAYQDHVTGLPNRHLFHDRLELGLAQARREGRYAAVIFVDLDDFKPINDNHGHAVGDRVLCVIAARLRETVRDIDTVTRLGGDEFAVFLPMLKSPEPVQRIADRLAEMVTAEIDGLTSEPLQISASFGIALFPTDGQDAASLLHSADQRMYQAKKKVKHNNG